MPQGLTREAGYASYRPVAEVDLEQAVEMIDSVIGFCCRNGIPGLFVDIRQLTGFPAPSTTERFWFISKWAETAAGKLTLVMVSRPELMDPEKIGVTMARNRGFNAEVFTDESEALDWLLGQLKPAQ